MRLSFPTQPASSHPLARIALLLAGAAIFTALLLLGAVVLMVLLGFGAVALLAHAVRRHLDQDRCDAPPSDPNVIEGDFHVVDSHRRNQR